MCIIVLEEIKIGKLSYLMMFDSLYIVYLCYDVGFKEKKKKKC